MEQRRKNSFPEMAKGALKAGRGHGDRHWDEAELESIVATGPDDKDHQTVVDNDVIFRKIEHAEKCGCLPLVWIWTTDG
jgi:hypothetical protein